MKNYVTTFSLLAVIAFTLVMSCSPAVNLTASWKDPKASPVKFSKILVLSIGKDLEKRRLGEDMLKAELLKNNFNAEAGLDVFSPDFAKAFDSLKMQQALLDKGFDGVITIRVLNVQEQERWVPGYYSPYVYRGFYRYYYHYYYYGFYNTGYMTHDIKVLLESNLYNVTTGDLIWSGQSVAFTRDPTPQMARRYASNIVNDLLNTKAITH
ncbi:MAG TPA: hypothetical protein VHB48_03965 [Chitinophagaceae bacterium]|nr:hypothetical protein [Chitinophagaceae bacterium]